MELCKAPSWSPLLQPGGAGLIPGLTHRAGGDRGASSPRQWSMWLWVQRVRPAPTFGWGRDARPFGCISPPRFVLVPPADHVAHLAASAVASLPRSQLCGNRLLGVLQVSRCHGARSSCGSRFPVETSRLAETGSLPAPKVCCYLPPFALHPKRPVPTTTPPSWDEIFTAGEK